MSQTITEKILAGETPESVGLLHLRGTSTVPQTSAFPDLETKGYTVLKGVIPKHRADQYVDEMYKWAEGMGLGFDRSERSTWRVQNMPNFHKGGLINRYGVGHEQFVWDIRGEAGVVDAFAKIWGTDELLVSFDAINLSLPYPKEELEQGGRGAAWAHVDQSPLRRFKHCVQGIVNLAPNGPDDGGLMVLEGSLPLYTEFFETHDPPAAGWSWRDNYVHTEAQVKWFTDRGCKWVKVEAEPGDLILWDSRCIHYGAAARGDRPRLATYVCYKPAKDCQPEYLNARHAAMKDYLNTTHDPILFRLTGAKLGGKLTPDERMEPRSKPVLTPRMEQLAGVREY